MVYSDLDVILALSMDTTKPLPIYTIFPLRVLALQSNMLRSRPPGKSRLASETFKDASIISSQVIQDVEFVLVEPFRNRIYPEGNQCDNQNRET